MRDLFSKTTQAARREVRTNLFPSNDKTRKPSEVAHENDRRGQSDDDDEIMTDEDYEKMKKILKMMKKMYTEEEMISKVESDDYEMMKQMKKIYTTAEMISKVEPDDYEMMNPMNKIYSNEKMMSEVEHETDNIYENDEDDEIYNRTSRQQSRFTNEKMKKMYTKDEMISEVEHETDNIYENDEDDEIYNRTSRQQSRFTNEKMNRTPKSVFAPVEVKSPRARLAVMRIDRGNKTLPSYIIMPISDAIRLSMKLQEEDTIRTR